MYDSRNEAEAEIAAMLVLRPKAKLRVVLVMQDISGYEFPDDDDDDFDV